MTAGRDVDIGLPVGSEIYPHVDLIFRTLLLQSDFFFHFVVIYVFYIINSSNVKISR